MFITPSMMDFLEHRPQRDSLRFCEAGTFHQIIGGVTLVLLLMTVWCLTHRYRGLIGDAGLYALQALARNDPTLARDVFLNGISQDRFTLFSPLYSLCVGSFGLHTAALMLLVLFKLGFFGAVWSFGRHLFDARTALLTTVLVIVMPGEYGAYHVFHVAEDMLTARTLAEALSMGALSLHMHGRRKLALGVAGIALLFHALMALPMLLLLLGLSKGARAAMLGSLVIVVAVLGAAAASLIAPHWTPSFLGTMNPAWVEMVRERSQFVFLELWRWDDWKLNLRPLLSVVLSMLVLPDVRVRVLCIAALSLGVAGLAVAFIAEIIGPVALLLQGQAWRWLWVPGLVSLLLAVPTVFRLWRSGPCGPLCAVSLLLGWLFPANGGMYCVAGSLLVWAVHSRVPASAGTYLRFSALGIGTLAIVWIFAHGWPTLSMPDTSGAGSGAVQIARRAMGLDGVPIIVAFLLWHALSRSRSIAVLGMIAVALGVMAAYLLPVALEDRRAEGSAAQFAEFTDWRDAIPPGDNVLVVSQIYSAAFAWFTLQRPDYLTVDQSSGVIFSSATAAEIRRRAEVLKPIEEPDWRLLSQRKSVARAKPLTKDRLIQICMDPQLNFVIAKEDVGFGQPMRHDRPGAWKDWFLYDCKRVNSLRQSVKDGARVAGVTSSSAVGASRSVTTYGGPGELTQPPDVFRHLVTLAGVTGVQRRHFYVNCRSLRCINYLIFSITCQYYEGLWHGPC